MNDNQKNKPDKLIDRSIDISDTDRRAILQTIVDLAADGDIDAVKFIAENHRQSRIDKLKLELFNI